ncbi:YpmS family protein [Psychrobacillus vulpis]|uniref:DUF2140 family protein n=1 Tax=Psychrobacillus vulpis TaxID=2325572 RepID=A0A544TTH4_9BACI|nr:YpmS family protein [Psychrobacillus vulpis]TQR20700.1 DUF2140 family protein [Psychrobacillus vulpis]
MNKWKIAFFLLVLVIVGSIIGLFYWITLPSDSEVVYEESPNLTGHVLTVNSTIEDFEGIANSFIKKAMEGKPVPLKLTLEDQVVLSSELTIFSFTLPVKLFFEPFVEENGDIRLEQSSIEVGQAKLDPATVLKLLNESIQLPEWIVVKPDEEEVLIQLASIPMTSGVRVRAKEINLAEDIITLEIVIPNE